MKHPNHILFQQQIQSGQRLSAAEQAALDQHLTDCVECREYAAFHRQLAEHLPALTTAPTHTGPAIRARAAAVNRKRAQRRWVAWIERTGLGMAGAAALLVLMLVMVNRLPGFLPGLAPQPTGPAAVRVEQATEPVAMPAALPTPLPTERAPRSTATPAAQATAAPAATLGSAVQTARKPTRSLAAYRQTVYIGMGDRLAAIDIQDPTTPQQIAQSEELPGTVGEVLLIPGDPAPRVVAAAGRYLVMLDTAEPGKLAVITQSKLPGPIHTLIVDLVWNRIYAGGSLLADPGKGYLVVMDSSLPDTLGLLDTVTLDAPAHSLGLARPVLYAALAGDAPGVAALTVENDRFGAPQMVLPGLSSASMTALNGFLYIGAQGKLLAYRLDEAPGAAPQLVWQLARAGSEPIPGMILGFVLRREWIDVAGFDRAGNPFRLVAIPPGPVETGTVIDTASYLSTSAGRLLVAGDQLEIYDLTDPSRPTLLGVYPPADSGE